MIRWALVFGYTLMIYAALPFARGWQAYLRRLFGSQFNVYLNLMLIAAALLPFFWLIRKISRLRLLVFIAVVLLACRVALQMELPEERIHLLQYAVLGYLTALAVSSQLKGWLAWISVMALGLLVGLGDELLQGLLPSRVFDWWDVSYNSAGVFLGWIVFLIVH